MNLEKIYANTPLQNKLNIIQKKPKTAEDAVELLKSKIWRLNNIYYIVDKKGVQQKFKMNAAQHTVYAALYKHPRLVILKSRQQGISTFWLISFFDDCITNQNLKVGFIAQGNEESETLFNRTKLLWDKLNPDIKKFFNLEIEKDSKRELKLNNNSHILIRTSFRGQTLHRLHASEVGKVANSYPQKVDELITGTLQAIAPELPVVLESTAEGENRFKEIWDNANSFSQNEDRTLEDFYPVFLPWVNDPDCSLDTKQNPTAAHEKYFQSIKKELNLSLTEQQKNFFIAKYRTLGHLFYQEYPATPEEAFFKDKGGTYYADIFVKSVQEQGRILPNLYNEDLPVYVSCDMGMDDYFVFIFFQIWHDGLRIFDYYLGEGKSIQDYCEVLNELNYKIETIYLPFDASIRDLGTGKSRESYFHEFGYRNTYKLKKTNSIATDIQEVRSFINKIQIDQKCKYIIQCFLNYRKVFDLKREVFTDKPQHDKYSHGADAIRYMIKSPVVQSFIRNKGLHKKIPVIETGLSF